MEQQDDLGILCRAALRYAAERPAGVPIAFITSSVARMVPLLSESDIRQLIGDVDHALSNPETDRHTWGDLMIALRRVG